MRKIRLLFSLLALVLFVEYAAGETDPSIQDLLKSEYPKLVLLSFTEGDFMGSHGQEYLAFYEDPTYRYEKSSPGVLVGKMVLVKDGLVKKKFDLDLKGLISNTYGDRYLKIMENPDLQFGRWASYAYVGDFNGNGFEEILFFQLTGMSFLPIILEYRGEDFAVIPGFKTPKNILSEIRTITRDDHKYLRLYGYGSDSSPRGKRDWHDFQWNNRTMRYEVVAEGME